MYKIFVEERKFILYGWCKIVFNMGGGNRLLRYSSLIGEDKIRRNVARIDHGHWKNEYKEMGIYIILSIWS